MTTKREALGMIYNINKFWHYLLVRKFTFRVDNVALLYLVAKQSLSGELARWMLLLQELEFKIQHRPRKQHAMADYLSWINYDDDVVTSHDDFLDAEILRITKTDVKDGNHFLDKWLMEMTSVLSTGLPPPKLRTDEKKRLAVRNWNFYLLLKRNIIP